MAQLNTLGIYLTEKCNFDCEYCYYKKCSAESLNIDQVKKALGIFFSQIKDRSIKTYITLIGGEPFLEKKLLLDSIGLINSYRPDFDIDLNVFTNGSLLDPKTAKILIENNVKICVSIDGIKEANDKYRHFKNSSASAFDVVFNNIKSLGSGILSKIYLNMVFTPETCCHLANSVIFFSGMGIYSIDVSLSTYEEWDEAAISVLKKQGVELIKYYTSLFSENSKIPPFHMYQIKNLQDRNWRCGLGCTSIKIGPDGNFYFCDSYFSLPPELRKKYAVGNLNEGIDFEKRQSIMTEADLALQKDFGKEYQVYKCKKRTICPYLIYNYSSAKGEDYRQRFENINRVSKIYSRIFLIIDHFLRGNKKYKELYNISESDYFEKFVRPKIF